MTESKIYQILGLCQKAGKLFSGEFAVKQAVINKEAILVIVAEDASENTKKLFSDKCLFRNISCVEWGTKEALGKSLGKEMRAVVGILDDGFAKKVREMLNSIQ